MGIERQNRILAAMNAASRARVVSRIEQVELQSGQVLFEPGDTLRHAYFPITSILSLLAILRDGSAVVTAVVGSEGGFGLLAGMGTRRPIVRCIVQIGGLALRARIGRVREEFGRSEQARTLIMEGCEALIHQTQQTVACNLKHPVNARLCRWLLMLHDRSFEDTLPLTHEALANLLGANRTSVTLAAKSLQRAGLITSNRGVVRIVDPRGLREAVCECYGSVQAQLAYLEQVRQPAAE
jgi:CRP-like cAMP-binding protein